MSGMKAESYSFKYLKVFPQTWFRPHFKRSFSYSTCSGLVLLLMALIGDIHSIILPVALPIS